MVCNGYGAVGTGEPLAPRHIRATARACLGVLRTWMGPTPLLHSSHMLSMYLCDVVPCRPHSFHTPWPVSSLWSLTECCPLPLHLPVCGTAVDAAMKFGAASAKKFLERAGLPAIERQLAAAFGNSARRDLVDVPPGLKRLNNGDWCAKTRRGDKLKHGGATTKEENLKWAYPTRAWKKSFPCHLVPLSWRRSSSLRHWGRGQAWGASLSAAGLTWVDGVSGDSGPRLGTAGGAEQVRAAAATGVVPVAPTVTAGVRAG